MQHLRELLIALHLLSMIGAFGALLLVQIGLPAGVRDTPANARALVRLPSWLLGIGLAVGLMLLGLTIRNAGTAALGGHFWGVIGLKLILLLVAFAMLGISGKRGSAGDVRTAATLRRVALNSLILAALLGVTLPM